VRVGDARGSAWIGHDWRLQKGRRQPLSVN
jgi:hypothetical protein